MAVTPAAPYRYKRPRGLAPWRPQRKTRELLAQVDRVLEEYEEHLPLTCRQIFYRLVGAYGYDKSENAYKRLLDNLVKARRSGRIPFEAIRDDGATVRGAGGFHDTADFWAEVLWSAEHYHRDRMDGQPRVAEVWVEAAGMVPQAARVAHAYGAGVYSSGGFDSLTVKYEAACRILTRRRPTLVLHVGDHDPSGLSVFTSAAEDVTALVADMDGEPALAPKFLRAAVTPEQIDHYQLPGAPPKKTDKRGEFEGETVQAEALPPDVLAEELHAVLAAWTDTEVRDAVIAREEKDREALVDMVAAGARSQDEPED